MYGDREMAKRKTDHIKTFPETRQLKCKLSPKDRDETAKQMADAILELQGLEQSHKTVQKEYNAKKQQLTEDVHRISWEIINQCITRDVKCELRLDYKKQLATVVRLDTKAVVEQRPLMEEEKQMELGFDGDNKNEEV
jgi:hypothetical protein